MATAAERRQLARLFEVYAHEFERSSPLYGHLAPAIARDDALLDLFARSPEEQRKPTLPLAAVHDLLLRGVEHPLRRYYRDLGGEGDPAEAFPVFRAFVFEHADALAPLLEERATQTNEVRRSAQLLPAFNLIAQECGGASLALVEIGASAGLNLAWDRYAYDYGPHGRIGDPSSPLVIDIDVRGAVPPPLPARMPSIAERIGIDLAPLDVSDPDDARWLRACVWPDQLDRAALLERALAVVRADPPRIVAGDAIEMLPSVVAGIAHDGPVVVYHSIVLPYLSDAARARLSATIAAIGAERDVWWLTSEGPRNVDLLADLPPEIEQHFAAARAGAARGGTKAEAFAVLGLVRWRGGETTRRHLARGGMQGHWIEWLKG